MTETPRRAVLFDAYPHVYAGAQRTDHLLARGLPGRGWVLEVLAPAPGPLLDRLAADGLPARVVAAPPALSRYGRTTTGRAALRAVAALPRYWWRLGRELRRSGAEVVHVVDHRGLVLAAVPARLRRLPLVWHVQALDATRLLNRWGSRLASVVVVPTPSVVPKLPGLSPRARVRAAANVVPDAVREVPMGPLAGEPVVVAVARLHPDKGLDVLVDAIAEVRRSVPGVRLRIVGGPQEGVEHLAGELRRQADRLGLGSAVELVGFVAEPHVEVRRARCFVQAARERTEILPLAILEAMAAGTPVVATDVGGVRDLVQTGRTGVLVPPEDPAALAEAIRHVLQDDAEAHRLRVAAHALATGPGYREEDLVAAIADAYGEAAGREGVGG
jgi:glycosyltransferase involved in cell wall biosynthesis